MQMFAMLQVALWRCANKSIFTIAVGGVSASTSVCRITSCHYVDTNDLTAAATGGDDDLLVGARVSARTGGGRRPPVRGGLGTAHGPEPSGLLYSSPVRF